MRPEELEAALDVVEWGERTKVADAKSAILAHVAALEAERDEWCRKATTAQHQWRKAAEERDAALADNAALAPLAVHSSECRETPGPTCSCPVGKDHPGAALLEDLETLRGRQALWEDAATALYGYAEFIGPCAHGRDPWDRCDECGEKNAVYAAQKVIVKMTEEHRKKWEAERVRLGNVLARLSEEVEHFSGKSCAAALSSILSGIERVAVRAKDEGRTHGIREAMVVCKEEGHPELMPCIADLLEETESD